jgi:pimeloyl-ACP methyl ester carboxylesterase
MKDLDWHEGVTHSTERDGIPISYVEGGRKESSCPTMLFVHGLTASARSWDPLYSASGRALSYRRGRSALTRERRLGRKAAGRLPDERVRKRSRRSDRSDWARPGAPGRALTGRA